MRILEIFSVVFSLFVLIRMFMVTKSEFHAMIPLVAIFDFAQVIPFGIELYSGLPNIPYKNFLIAMEDKKTTQIFVLFIIAVQLVFLYEIERINKAIKKGQHQTTIVEFVQKVVNSKYRPLLIMLCYIAFLYVIAGIMMSPDPSIYLDIKQYDPVYYYAMRQRASLLAVATILLKLLDTNHNFFFWISRLVFIIVATLVDKKRTLLMIVVGMCFIIDYVSNRNSNKRLLIKYTIIFGLTAWYFVFYANYIGKTGNDWYYTLNEYIFREMHLRFTIYAALNPTQIHILDYPGQSVLFNLFWWIPRALWKSKPRPFYEYYISGVLGYGTNSYDSIGWSMPASYFTEFVSNFGILGLVIGAWFTIWMARFFERRDLLCKLLGISLISILEIYYYDDAMKILALVVLVLYLMEKVHIENRGYGLVLGIGKRKIND
ncbi:hypothetical protein BTH82_07615 [Lactobacillus delbrueckii subsp. bulgaricus]|nr:hypothetical protein [Lactobacillus delbrueckii subsp. bulgaricus]MBT8864278.1 hypothetical protein [Lactobacillus delbrueckii subsp. bulgaricus]MBT8865876.1 hypothetical protein [Lactobacillus delbrueckii subsp. bulgaricus]MBT8869060.1 hypothetical protein [Lactobacillus delbrueckii subsp. bulgaricus]MBT8872194.1 hypothetical protein [Lactobacillus delbrueckii subsp. bulgaricus]